MAASSRCRIPSSLRLGRTVAVAGLALLVGAIGLTGCRAAEAPSSVANAGGGMAGAPPIVDGAAHEVSAAGEGDAAAPLAPVQERALIYTGTLTVQVESVALAADEASAVVIGLGGIVAGDTRTIDEKRSQATLVLRVPADRFTSTLDRLARLGTE